jgi:predicted nuclease of predicted toxin-antitoxin system
VMLKFIIDTQSPPALAASLNKKGIDATHVISYPMGEFTSDKEIIDIASKEERVIITKDSDFFDYYLLKGFPPAILWLRIGNIKNKDLIEIIDKQLNLIQSLFIENRERLLIFQNDVITVF